jgi:hypothetical protein
VASTFMLPSAPTSITVTSNVPPPRSKTRIRPVLALSRPWAMAAAVGSLTMCTTSRPAISPAVLVAARSLSPKYAGTVMTTRRTGSLNRSCAMSASFFSTEADSSSGDHVLPSTANGRSPSRNVRSPMPRLNSIATRSGSTIARCLALAPTSWAPSLPK